MRVTLNDESLKQRSIEVITISFLNAKVVVRFWSKLFVVTNKYCLFCLWTKGRKYVTFQDLSSFFYQKHAGRCRVNALDEASSTSCGTSYNSLLPNIASVLFPKYRVDIS